MRIVILGAGVQGTFYGVRLARAGHQVTLIAWGGRAEELRERGAMIEDSRRVTSVSFSMIGTCGGRSLSNGQFSNSVSGALPLIEKFV